MDEEARIWLAGFLRLNPKIDTEIALAVIKEYILDMHAIPELHTERAFSDMVDLILEASKERNGSKVIH